ncbi:FISUMP domain-containing protein [Mucilaginibacter sp.]|uniref:FISUMP domain-containing protein n=1 Tax=Mucilaginibacter sp. TaxID=1882438 RepID=UPI002849B78A|nr:FISUMP domain-containing protein [Mucilaginibacter sp.]MDR3695571.1 FISUMP domain-containing protein [Mucilaginibacter sp.]
MRGQLKLLFIVSILLTACTKKHNPTPVTNIKGSVNINGTIYSTIAIGHQIWTTQNYDGPGGVGNAQEASIGKFYLLSEIQSIKLPSGWRIPTQADFISLLQLQGSTTINSYGEVIADSTVAKHLMATSKWSIIGDNKSGFNVIPSGEYSISQSFNSGNDEAKFWSSTSDTIAGTPQQWVLQVTGYDYTYTANQEVINGQNAYVNMMPQVGYGYNLRFVKDN